MSAHIGNRIPAPLRFEFGEAPAGDTARALLLATIDADGLPRIAVLSAQEVTAPDDRRVCVDVRDGSATGANLKERGKAALWCILDGAAYTLKGAAGGSSAVSSEERGWCRFVIEIESVWRDFEPSAPMVGGPTYRTTETRKA